MGKKQKSIQHSNVSNDKQIQNVKVVAGNDVEKENDKSGKVSKNEKRKMKRLAKIASLKAKGETNTANEQQKTVLIEQQPVRDQMEQEIQQNEQSLIEAVQESLEEDFENDIEFNLRGKQGFQSLINEATPQGQNQIKSLSFKTTLYPENDNTVFLFHLKKEQFYKVIVPTHQTINLTHLNQAVKLTIVDQNLLKNASHDLSCQFLQNGKKKSQHIEFLRSALFKIVHIQNDKKQIPSSQSKDKKKNSQISSQETIKKNIQQFIKPSTSEQLDQIVEFLRDFQWKEDSLVICRENIIMSQTTGPFENIDPKILNSNGSLMILGRKNAGKSTLAEYLKNIKPSQVCILDCDIGRSLTVSGCVSLITQSENINLWVGEFTPFNCIKNYVNAIQKLYQLYRQKYFSKKLIINTMGYLSGLGEMIIYEIYNLVNPSEIIVLNYGNDKQSSDNLSGILYHIKTGSYLNKLLTLSSSEFSQKGIRRFNEKKLNLNIQYLTNIHAQGKGIPIRFESIILHKKSFKNILELIQSIKNKEMQKILNLNIYEQDKLGNIVQLNKYEKNHGDMRIVLIGKWIQFGQSVNDQTNNQENQKLFRVFGIGYGFEGAVFYSRQQIQQVLSPSINLKQDTKSLAGILSEGIDFEKNFYLINEISLIEHELNYGRIPYIMPIIKGMGSKGTRNNPSKNG